MKRKYPVTFYEKESESDFKKWLKEMLENELDLSETATEEDIIIIKKIANTEINKQGIMSTNYEELLELSLSDLDEEIWSQDDSSKHELDTKGIIQIDAFYYKD